MQKALNDARLSSPLGANNTTVRAKFCNLIRVKGGNGEKREKNSIYASSSRPRRRWKFNRSLGGVQAHKTSRHRARQTPSRTSYNKKVREKVEGGGRCQRRYQAHRARCHTHMMSERKSFLLVVVIKLSTICVAAQMMNRRGWQDADKRWPLSAALLITIRMRTKMTTTTKSGGGEEEKSVKNFSRSKHRKNVSHSLLEMYVDISFASFLS